MSPHNPYDCNKVPSQKAGSSKGKGLLREDPLPSTAITPLESFGVNDLVFAGTTARRPQSPSRGAFYLNTELGYAELWDGYSWVNMADLLPPKNNPRRDAIKAQQAKVSK